MGSNDPSYRPLGVLTENFDSLRIPVKESERKPGPYAYYGASGIIDWIDGYIFDGDYLLIAEDGENLRSRKTPVAFLANGKFWVNNHAHIVRGNKDADTRFLMYALSVTNINGYLTGSTIPKLTQENLNRIPIFAHPLPEQRAIADVLGSLDDKIELNRRMNATLESMARAVFRQWFVESDDAKGWKVVPLPEVIDVNPSRSLKKGDIAPYLDMANMPTQGHRGIEWIDRPFGSGTKFINGDTLLARITPCLENGKTAFVDFLADEQVGWGSTEYIILRPKLPLPVEYGYYLARSEELRNHTIQNMTGTSGRQRAPASCFDKYMLAVPPESLANRFGDFARSVMAKIQSNDEQSRTLAALRDALLPRLMSGEVRVKDREILQ